MGICRKEKEMKFGIETGAKVLKEIKGVLEEWHT